MNTRQTSEQNVLPAKLKIEFQHGFREILYTVYISGHYFDIIGLPKEDAL